MAQNGLGRVPSTSTMASQSVVPELAPELSSYSPPPSHTPRSYDERDEDRPLVNPVQIVRRQTSAQHQSSTPRLPQRQSFQVVAGPPADVSPPASNAHAPHSGTRSTSTDEADRRIGTGTHDRGLSLDQSTVAQRRERTRTLSLDRLPEQETGEGRVITRGRANSRRGEPLNLSGTRSVDWIVPTLNNPPSSSEKVRHPLFWDSVSFTSS